VRAALPNHQPLDGVPQTGQGCGAPINAEILKVAAAVHPSMLAPLPRCLHSTSRMALSSLADASCVIWSDTARVQFCQVQASSV
jgi:hypothetical protein